MAVLSTLLDDTFGREFFLPYILWLAGISYSSYFRTLRTTCIPPANSSRHYCWLVVMVHHLGIWLPDDSSPPKWVGHSFGSLLLLLTAVVIEWQTVSHAEHGIRSFGLILFFFFDGMPDCVLVYLVLHSCNQEQLVGIHSVVAIMPAGAAAGHSSHPIQEQLDWSGHRGCQQDASAILAFGGRMSFSCRAWHSSIYKWWLG